ncbi:hypothetical protein AKO1_005972 [Acrasis kona]|uniref:Uncharacterized protein n=1 Tax=Acrasis kona TaxID=1008807 RepID=A0AAW2ZMF0_9EUKA
MKQQEDVLRRLFVSDRDDPTLSDPHLLLIPVFDRLDSFRQLQEPPPSIPLLFNKSYANHSISTSIIKEKYIICDGLSTFKNQFDQFTDGLFRNVDWSNMVVAGGSVLACCRQSKRDGFEENEKRDFQIALGVYDDEEVDLDAVGDSYLRDDGDDRVITTDDLMPENNIKQYAKRFDQTANNKFIGCYGFRRRARLVESDPFAKSDIDIFLYDLTPQQAVDKVKSLYESFNASHQQIFMMRTQSAITFKLKAGSRTIQIITRLYKSPAEVLIGFDVDSCCVCYDGSRVWGLPRFQRSIVNRMNLVDVDRQSTTYELRLFKYAKRGFRVGVPGYDETRIKNHRVLNNSVVKQLFKGHADGYNYKALYGLARLILLERTCNKLSRRYAGRYIGVKCDLWNDESIAGLENKINHLKPGEPVDVDPKIQRRARWNRYRSYVNEKVDIKYHVTDYVSVVVKVDEDPTRCHARMNDAIRVMKSKENGFVADFVYSLNDLDVILDNKEQESTLVGPIEWITVNPGTQDKIGSFNPVDRNFYRDAYTRSAEQDEMLSSMLSRIASRHDIRRSDEK